MARCIKCGRSGPDLVTNHDCLCPRCAEQVRAHRARVKLRDAKSELLNQGTLARYRQYGTEQVQVLCAHDCTCALCKSYAGRPYKLSQAPRLPAHRGCRCCYAPWTYSDRRRWAQEQPDQDVRPESTAARSEIPAAKGSVSLGAGIAELRHPDGVALRPMRDHAVIHALSIDQPEELRLLHLLMRLAGNSVGYERTGVTSILYPDVASDIDQLRARGYLLEPLPLDMLMTKVTVPVLKNLLRDHQLPVGGKRAELLARLLPVIADAEVEELRRFFGFWWPSDYGYEMLYSYYDYWEHLEWAVICALYVGDAAGVRAAILDLAQCYPHRFEVGMDINGIENTLYAYRNVESLNEVQLRALYQVLTGCTFEMWFNTPNFGR